MDALAQALKSETLKGRIITLQKPDGSMEKGVITIAYYLDITRGMIVYQPQDEQGRFHNQLPICIVVPEKDIHHVDSDEYGTIFITEPNQFGRIIISYQ